MKLNRSMLAAALVIGSAALVGCDTADDAQQEESAPAAQASAADAKGQPAATGESTTVLARMNRTFDHDRRGHMERRRDERRGHMGGQRNERMRREQWEREHNRHGWWRRVRAWWRRG